MLRRDRRACLLEGTKRRLLPEWSAIAGTARAAAKPPIGTDVWRIPSARPRCSRGNQLVTTRPLAVLIDAPNAPDSVSATTSPGNPARTPRQRAPRPAEEADRARHPVSDPVGRHPPWQQRQRRPHARQGKHHADLREAQVVAVAQRRRQHGQPAERRRLRRLRDRPGREDDPAPYARRSGYSCRLELPRSGSWSPGTPSHPPCAGAPWSRCPRG